MPNNAEAEESVIGSLLLDPDGMVKVADILKPSDFFNEAPRRCYEACLALYSRSDVVDEVTVGEELARQGRLADVGGRAYLAATIRMLPTSLNLEQYAQMVMRLALRRNLIGAASEIAAMSYGGGGDDDLLLAKAEGIIGRLSQDATGRDARPVRDDGDEFLRDMVQATMPEPRAEHQAATPTGLADMDQLLGGLQRTDLVIVAARPSVGKSALAVNIARNAAKMGATVLLLSLEMSRKQIYHRLLATETRIDSHRIRLGLVSQAEEELLMRANGELSDLRIYVDDTAMLTMLGIRTRAKRLHLRHSLDLIIVDYLQLIQGTGSRDANRVQEISEISRGLKVLAKQLNVPVLACSQLSRQVEYRSGHRPQLSDLRDSGSIEQDADVVMFIHREELYATPEEWELRHPDAPYPAGVAEIIVAKHRNGPVGSLWLRFNGRLARFEDLPITVDAEGVVTGR